jgi:hypothetical protein
MHSVISICVTLILTWLAVFVTISGLKVSAEAATTIQSNQSNEYRAHYCGSLRAAIANLESARELLIDTDAANAKDYTRISNAYLSMLEEALDTHLFTCSDYPTNIHTQSFEETPFDLPNQVYRLNGLDLK